MWSIPFFSLLLCIAIFPIIYKKIWHYYFGYITLIWTLAFILPFGLKFGAYIAISSVIHILLTEYIPFIILLITLFVVTGGIYISGNINNTPICNTILLIVGTCLASFIGTTSASMLLIRLVLRANNNRKYVTHIFIFFIFLVANAGGSLTPLGDPPLFFGFLKGVDFFWITYHIFPEMLFLCSTLLIIFYCLDYFFYFKKEKILSVKIVNKITNTPINFTGKWNILLLIITISLVLIKEFLKLGISFQVLSTSINLEDIVLYIILIGIILISLRITPISAYLGNNFSWKPILEVTKLFGGIFITIIPVMAILQAGQSGEFKIIIQILTNKNGQPIDAMYFWITGLLSSFLDNAPTYLMFFNIASGDAHTMMTTLSSTLLAISSGAVFMGANSYIGNAPNMMIKAIVEDHGIYMPSFFGYIKWSVLILIPLFILMTFIFFI